MTEKSLFLAALAINDTSARADFIVEACAGDNELRSQVEELLRCYRHAEAMFGTEDEDRTHLYHKESDTDIAQPPVRAALASEVDTQLNQKVGEHREFKSGDVIGAYCLQWQIDKGGMGTVWMAEELHPVRRFVALKLINSDVYGDAALARFESESQALALMDHPNIGKFYSGGFYSTDAEAGRQRPFFVMELIKGSQIIQYCDENKLSIRQRLELFLEVCGAIEHLHQKGVIHRDIKADNVLIAVYADRAVPKVIDFGMAKALGQPLTNKSGANGHLSSVVGTPAYMAPEQARLNAFDDTDTRSDVYSLGVLLFELLTATTPLDAEKIKEKIDRRAWGEVFRMVRESEPPKPSQRLMDSKQNLATISANRQCHQARIAKSVRGELDWIIMKSLEKVPELRYASVSQLAHDIRCYLKYEPLIYARPSSAWYPLSKYLMRHTRPFLQPVPASLAFLIVILITLMSYRLLFDEPYSEAMAEACERVTWPESPNIETVKGRPPVEDYRGFEVRNRSPDFRNQ